MAIAEAEPKKSEVAVTSSGPSQCAKPLDTIKIFSEKDELASSSSRNVIKTYDLYSNVKDFTFYMPDGWNDQDIGIFIELCRENIGGLRDMSMDENSKWQEIVDAGAKRSLNPTLFTINSCMEVAQCIRQYVTRNMDKKKNEAFQKFCEDVKTLLKYFPPSPAEVMRKRRRGKGKFLDMKECEKVFSDDSEEERQLSASIYRHIAAFQANDPGVWDDIAEEIDEKTNYDIDVKEYMELMKTNLISDIYEGSDPQARKEVFSKIRPYLLEIFDYVSPRCVSKQDIKNFVYGPVKAEESISSTNKEDSLISRKRRPSPNKFPENPDGVSSLESVSTHENKEVPKESVEVVEGSSMPVKRKRGRPRKEQRHFGRKKADFVPMLKKDGQPSFEPSSTTLLDEGSHTDSSHSQRQSVSSEKDSETTEEMMPSDEYQTRHRGDRWKRMRPRPTRVLPSREARNRVSSSISSKREKSHVAQRQLNHIPNTIDMDDDIEDPETEDPKRSPNFRGFEDTDSDDSEEETSRKLRVVRKVTTTRRTFTRTTLPNPDTTTNDLDETESVSSQRNSTDDDLSYVKRLTRQTKESVIKGKFVTEEKVENKVTTFVQADSTLNPVVKLHIMKESELQEGLRRKPPAENYLPGIDEEELTFSVPSAKPNIPVESAVLGKDVIKSVYNPNSDSAKTHAGPGSPTSIRRSANRGRRGACHVPPKRKGLKSHYSYYSDSDGHQRTQGRNCNLQGECSSTVVCLSDKSRQRASINNPASQSLRSQEQAGTSQGKKSKSSIPTDMVSERGSTALAPQIAGMSGVEEPSTSNVSAYNNNMVVALMNMLQEFNNKELNLANLNAAHGLERFHNKPKWFEEFYSDFHRNQIWKMQQVVKMQQELVDVENQKVLLVKELIKCFKDDTK